MSGTILLFADDHGDRAALYVHSDATDSQELLEEFFTNEDVTMTGTSHYSNRYDDPEYLAARFVAFMNGKFSGGTGVGVTVPSERSDDNLRVLCTQESRPRIAVLDA